MAAACASFSATPTWLVRTSLRSPRSASRRSRPLVVANANIRRGAGLAYLAVVFALCHGLAIRKRRAKAIANDAASHD